MKARRQSRVSSEDSVRTLPDADGAKPAPNRPLLVPFVWLGFIPDRARGHARGT